MSWVDGKDDDDDDDDDVDDIGLVMGRKGGVVVVWGWDERGRKVRTETTIATLHSGDYHSKIFTGVNKALLRLPPLCS